MKCCVTVETTIFTEVEIDAKDEDAAAAKVTKLRAQGLAFSEFRVLSEQTREEVVDTKVMSLR